jgi:hypothetical protein
MDFNHALALAPVLLQVLMIDLVLAGDNAVVIGLAVNLLPAAQRRQAIWAGIGGATVIRIIFALIALRMLAIIGLTLAGGILLLWVVWKSARELRGAPHEAAAPGSAGAWAGGLGRADGGCRQPGCPAADEIPVSGLDRPCDRSVCLADDDLCRLVPGDSPCLARPWRSGQECAELIQQ